MKKRVITEYVYTLDSTTRRVKVEKVASEKVETGPPDPVTKRMKVEKVASSDMAPERKVLSAARSPMNPLQWNCELDCGHTLWRTSQRKPRRVGCTHCRFEALRKSGAIQ